MDKRDITTRKDIQLLVDEFYARAMKDPLIGPIFLPIQEGGKWPQHVVRIYDFWHALLLGEPRYTGNAFAPHADMPLTQRHFDRWLALFHATIDAHFSGPTAEKARNQSTHIAQLFHGKIQFRKRYEQD